MAPGQITWRRPECSFHRAQAEKLVEWLQKHYGNTWSDRFEHLAKKAGAKVFKSQTNDGAWIFSAKDKTIDSYIDYLPKNINIDWYTFEEKIPVVENITIGKTNAITLCFAANEKYMRYLGVTLKSILENHKGKAFFDVVILTRGCLQFAVID